MKIQKINRGLNMPQIVGSKNIKIFKLYIKKPSIGIHEWFIRIKSTKYGMIDDQSMKFKKLGYQTKIETSDSHRVAH